MDGTDQLSNGIPQFRESSKDDTGQMRIKNHLEVVQIAGAPDIIKCYVVPEDVANDSNVSVEVLQRTLKAEERRRGDLPPLLNVQLDNCRGANKNTFLFAYLAWLIEREVFSVVFVSFLPVGHTHNGPDRISSRISNAVRKTNIFTERRFFQVIEGSHEPSPKVEVINKVADFKQLINPGGKPALTGASVRRLEGLCTLRPSTLASLQRFMKTTSSLHFRVAKDPTTGRACIQNKQTIDVQAWSPVEYIWNNKRVTAKDPLDFTNWLDTLKTAASVPIEQSRYEDLRKYLKTCAWRLEEEQVRALQARVESLHRPRPEVLPVHWDDNGRFLCEFDRVVDSEDAAPAIEPTIQLADRNCIILRPTVRAQLRDTSLANPVTVDDFIAYRPFYNDQVPKSKRVPQYVGKVSHVDADQNRVQIRTYHTPDSTPLQTIAGKSTKYKPWTGQGMYQDVSACDILHVFQPVMDHGKKGKATHSFTFTSAMKECVLKVLAAEQVEAGVQFG